MMLMLFVIAMIAGLCVCYYIGSKIPHRPAPKEVKVIRHVLADDAWTNLLKLGKSHDEGWTPEIQVHSKEGYKKMRARKLTDWILP